MAAVQRPPNIEIDTWLALPEELQRELAASGPAGQSSVTSASWPAPAPSRPEPIALDDSDSDDDLIVVSEKITTKGPSSGRPPLPQPTDDESFARQLQANEYAAFNNGSGPSMSNNKGTANDDAGERVLFDAFEPPQSSGPVDLRWFTSMNDEISRAKARARSKKSSESKKGQSSKDSKGKKPAKPADSDTDSSVTGDERPKKGTKR